MAMEIANKTGKGQENEISSDQLPFLQ